MSRKPILIAFLTFALVCSLSAAFQVKIVEASGTIYIKADGSVDPPTANITNVDNATYYLTDNINASITVKRDNIVIDGAGHTLQGTGTWDSKGMDLSDRSNVTIKNMEIKAFDYGIWLNQSSNNIIQGNNITNNTWAGIELRVSSSNTISGNNIKDNSCAGIIQRSSNNNTISGNNIADNYYYGICLFSSSLNNNIVGNTFTDNGLYVITSYGNTVVENTVNGKPIVYLEDVSNYTVDDAGQVVLVNCDNILVEKLDIYTTCFGVILVGTKNSGIVSNNITAKKFAGTILYDSVSNNITANYLDGIELHGSLNNIVSENNIPNNTWAGIFLDESSHNTIAGNNVANNERGIWLYYHSHNNTVMGNNIGNNGGGIFLQLSTNNIIVGNNIPNNSDGLTIYDSRYNFVYHNNFINNTRHVRILTSDCSNFWNNVVEGNYWDTYAGVDLDHDGIGDRHHIIDVNNTDNYPLMGMFSSFNTSLGYYVNVISNSTIEYFQFFEFSSIIRMGVSNMTGNQTYGFCRICIPHALMSEPCNITVDGAEPYYVNYTLYDDGENRWIYFSYRHPTLEIIIVPEFPSLLILPLFMIATLLAVIVYRRKHTG